MNVVISGSVLDEAFAAELPMRSEMELAPRRRLLAQALERLARWQSRKVDRLDCVRPEAGALCCFRLRADVFDADAVARFWALLLFQGVKLAPGPWFGGEGRVFRLGFGHRPGRCTGPALAALSRMMDETLVGQADYATPPAADDT